MATTAVRELNPPVHEIQTDEFYMSMPYFLDWFSGTTHACTIEEAMDHFGGEWHPNHGTAGYDYGWTNEKNISLFGSTKRADHQGVHVNIPGSAEPTRYIRKLKQKDFLPSRIDLTQDTEKMTIEQVFQAILENRVVAQCRTENISEISKRGKVQTIYFGGANSDSRVCVYDKAAEMGREDITLTRFEYRYRSYRAKEIWNNLENVDGVVRMMHSTMRVLAKSYSQKSNARNKLDPNFAKVLAPIAAGAAILLSSAGNAATLQRNSDNHSGMTDYGLSSVWRKWRRRKDIEAKKEAVLRFCKWIRTMWEACPDTFATFCIARPDPLRLSQLREMASQAGLKPREFADEVSRMLGNPQSVALALGR